MSRVDGEIKTVPNLIITVFNDVKPENRETSSVDPNISVCLPVVTASNDLLWIDSDQVDSLHGAGELQKAYNRLPYLTTKRTVRVAQRHPLQPDDVKLWFMAQRLENGKSWDQNDIRSVWTTLNVEQKKTNEENAGEQKEEEQNVPEREEEKDGEEQNATGIETTEQNVASNEQVEENTERAQPTIQETSRKEGNDKVKKTTKRKIQAEGGKRKKKKKETIAENATEGEIKNENTTPSDGAPRTEEENRELNTKQDDKSLIDKPLEHVSSLDKCPLVPQGHSTQPSVDSELPCSQCSNSTKMHCKLSFLRGIFLNCQYPSKEYYKQLEKQTGMPHRVLVQWFGDLRYYIKKAKPRWMTVEQHGRAVANVKCKQSPKIPNEKTQTTEDNFTINTSIETSTSIEEEQKQEVKEINHDV